MDIPLASVDGFGIVTAPALAAGLVGLLVLAAHIDVFAAYSGVFTP